MRIFFYIYSITNDKNSFAFDTTGILEGNRTDEMDAFYTSLQNYISENTPKKGVQTALITTIGLKQSKNADAVQYVIVLNDLFTQ